jgi:hypothetical protein
VLSEQEFGQAVRDALREISHPNSLRNNPLLQSRLIIEKVGASLALPERIAALQTLVKKAADGLQHSSRDARLYRVLYHTYLSPAPTQEQAAELLDLPFSTYRRHLKSAIERVAEIMWQWELAGAEI